MPQWNDTNFFSSRLYYILDIIVSLLLHRSYFFYLNVELKVISHGAKIVDSILVGRETGSDEFDPVTPTKKKLSRQLQFSKYLKIFKYTLSILGNLLNWLF